MTVSELNLMADIQAHPNIRGRVTAAVMNARWDNPNGNVQGKIPLDDIMWAIATSDIVMAKVKAALESAEEADRRNADRAILIGVEDQDIMDIIRNVALPRLQGSTPPA